MLFVLHATLVATASRRTVNLITGGGGQEAEKSFLRDALMLRPNVAINRSSFEDWRYLCRHEIWPTLKDWLRRKNK